MSLLKRLHAHGGLTSTAPIALAMTSLIRRPNFQVTVSPASSRTPV